MPRAKRPVKPMTIRLPLDLYDDLSKLADRHYRLLTQEIVLALRRYVESEKGEHNQ